MIQLADALATAVLVRSIGLFLGYWEPLNRTLNVSSWHDTDCQTRLEYDNLFVEMNHRAYGFACVHQVECLVDLL